MDGAGSVERETPARALAAVARARRSRRGSGPRRRRGCAPPPRATLAAAPGDRGAQAGADATPFTGRHDGAELRADDDHADRRWGDDHGHSDYGEDHDAPPQHEPYSPRISAGVGG